MDALDLMNSLPGVKPLYHIPKEWNTSRLAVLQQRRNRAQQKANLVVERKPESETDSQIASKTVNEIEAMLPTECQPKKATPSLKIFARNRPVQRPSPDGLLMPSCSPTHLSRKEKQSTVSSFEIRNMSMMQTIMVFGLKQSWSDPGKRRVGQSTKIDALLLYSFHNYFLQLDAPSTAPAYLTKRMSGKTMHWYCGQADEAKTKEESSLDVRNPPNVASFRRWSSSNSFYHSPLLSSRIYLLFDCRVTISPTNCRRSRTNRFWRPSSPEPGEDSHNIETYDEDWDTSSFHLEVSCMFWWLTGSRR